jgi:tetratricopeptide (TPR) repeat protein
LRIRWVGGAVALAGALALAGGAAAGAREDGLRLAAEGRCAEALPLLAGAPDAERARALCLLEEADYAAAAEALERLEPGDPSLAVELGIALFHAGDAAGAEAALRRAEARGSDRAEVPLYLGLIALQHNRAPEARARFERAAASGGDALSAAALYYGGIAQAQVGDADAARDAFARVAREWPDTPWAAQAERAAASLAAARDLFATLRVGFEHDSNAVLRGEGVVLPDEIPSQRDQRFVWRGVLGRSWRAGEARLGSVLSFNGSLHGDLTRFDVLQPSLTLWADRRLGERTMLRAIAAYSRAWVGTRDFLSEPSFALELRREGSRGTTRAFAELALDDFRFASVELDPALRRARDRDGLGSRLGLEQRVPLPALDATLSGMLAYRRFSADGTEYSFDAPEIELGLEARLPASFLLDAGVFYAYRAYRHPTTYGPPPRRRGNDWRTELALRRPIWRGLSLEARWRYQRNDSTANVFDYTRHVAGLYASWSLNP